MVDGVHGLKDHVPRLVVVESSNLLDHVTVLLFHVEAYPVQAIVLMKKHVMNFVAVVRLYSYIMLNKNTWGVKKCETNQKQHVSRQVRPKALISAEAKELVE